MARTLNLALLLGHPIEWVHIEWFELDGEVVDLVKAVMSLRFP